MKGPLTEDRISIPLDALLFLTECTLATVSSLASRSRPPKHELQRQISIAQTGIDHIKGAVEPGSWCGCSRVQEIIDRTLTVQAWTEEKHA